MVLSHSAAISLFVGNILTIVLSDSECYVGFSDPEVSKLNDSLMTPSSITFSIWLVIYTLETLLLIILCTCFSSIEDVGWTMSYPFIKTCIVQSLWIICFSQQRLFVGSAFLFCAADFLNEAYNASLLAKDHFSSPALWFIGLNAPFSVHYSWIFIAAIVNLNLMVSSWNFDPVVDIICAMLSLLAITVHTCYRGIYCGDVICLVVTDWVAYGITRRLSESSIQKNDDRFKLYKRWIGWFRFFCHALDLLLRLSIGGIICLHMIGTRSITQYRISGLRETIYSAIKR